MKITADTNVLIRAAVPAPANSEDAVQAERARSLLSAAELIAVTTASLCEFVWVLRRAYGYSATEIAGAIRALCSGRGVVADLAAVEAGLKLLLAGGDFADGVIAHEGGLLGGESFRSFDRQAVRLLKANAVSAAEA